MFSFKIDVAEFNKLTPFFGSYLDILYKDRTVVICSENGQCYVQYMCPAFSMTPNDSVNVRLDTALFSNMVLDGKVEVTVVDSQVSFSFYNDRDKLFYKTIVPKQVSYIDLQQKSIIFSRFKDTDCLSFNDYSYLVRLCSKLKTPFISSEGYCYTYYNKNYIFKKSVLPDFCVDSELLRKCISVTNEFAVVGDFLVFKSGKMSIILQKQKLPLMCDIPYITSVKARRHVTLNISNLLSLLSKLRLKTNFVTRLNLDVSRCYIDDEQNRFEVPIEIMEDSNKSKSIDSLLSDLEKGLDDGLTKKETPNDSVLYLPYWLPKVVDRVSKCDLYVSKRFCILKFNGVNITIGGSLNA